MPTRYSFFRSKNRPYNENPTERTHMFKNKSLQVSVVKNPTDGSDPVELETNAETIASVSVAVKDVMQEGVKLIGVVIAMDTVRKVVLALVTRR